VRRVLEAKRVETDTWYHSLHKSLGAETFQKLKTDSSNNRLKAYAFHRAEGEAMVHMEQERLTLPRRELQVRMVTYTIFHKCPRTFLTFP
jgi:hypothetical protein